MGMPAKVKVGFVGSGGMAEAHAKALGACPEAKVVAFSDVELSRAKDIAGRYGARAFKKPAEMFDTMALDAVYLCLPPFAHGTEFEAIERSIPFFVEKPINLDLGQAHEIAAAVEAKQLLTCAGYMNRYRKGVQKVRALLAKDPAVMLTGGWIGPTPRPRPGYGIHTWWVQKKKSGGQFLEQVTHTVDLARYLVGSEAVEVFAYAATGFNIGTPDNYDLDDAALVNIRFASGAIANLWSSCSSNAAGGVSLNVYAAQHAAFFTGWSHAVRIVDAAHKEQQIPGEDDIFAIQDAAFVKAVRKGDQSLVMSTYADAVNTLAISVAANRSLKTGKPVALK